ncbi:MAG: oxidoreductase [Puniceicoccaceae bacterium MED-G30]|nr:MAG: oxidoreductase [Puniceicoccaceae bacterium MED-G30]|tara:strand:+ start:1054 stop:2115 length:1062 start_codon:yes stop_codon:yes gene_type:complete
MESKLRVGFIGAGANTRQMHLPGFQKQANVELAAVANRTVESSRAVAEKFGILRYYGDWREIVEDSAIDAVCIGTWPNLHAEATIAALNAGKHVLCEARMACDLREARAMLAAAHAQPKKVAQLVPAPFSLDFDSTIRAMVLAGELGDLLEVRVVHTVGHLACPEAAMSWRQDISRSGQNVLTMGIMHETILRWIDEEPSWILADGAVFQTQRSYPGEGASSVVEIPDSLSVIGRLSESGARLVYHFSGVESGKSRMEFRLNGSKGALRFDAFQKQLLFAEAGSSEERKITLSREQSRGWQVEADFIASIRSDKPVRLTSFADGVRYMQFTQMVADSLADKSRRVEGAQYTNA